MRRRARFHSNQARIRRCKERHDLRSSRLPASHHGSDTIDTLNLKDMLRDVQPNRDNSAHGRSSSSGPATATLYGTEMPEAGGRPPHQVTCAVSPSIKREGSPSQTDVSTLRLSPMSQRRPILERCSHDPRKFLATARCGARSLLTSCAAKPTNGRCILRRQYGQRRPNTCAAARRDEWLPGNAVLAASYNRSRAPAKTRRIASTPVPNARLQGPAVSLEL